MANSRGVFDPNRVNLIQAVLHARFAPVTQARTQPYGMPPFMIPLSNANIALLLTFIRQSWGKRAAAVTESDVNQLHKRQASR